MKCYSYLLVFLGIVFCSFQVSSYNAGSKAIVNKDSVKVSAVYRISAESVKINNKTSVIIADDRLTNKKGMTLKPGVQAATEGERVEPDLVFDLKVPKPGQYVMYTYAVTDAEGDSLMKKAKGKYESIYMRIQINNLRPTKRVVYVPWNRPLQKSGKFELSGELQQLKIWLPRGVRLGYIELRPYMAPSVPVQARNYKPKVLPPSSHPRLWVNRNSLPLVKERLEIGENKAAWIKVKTAAQTPFLFKFDPAAEMSYDEKLERAAESKAFYYLMSGDKKVGREAVTLMREYLSHVEFGNILDITREIGRAIYSASEVYDWCYDLLTPEEKKVFCDNLMRLADEMEIGWPPFLTTIVNGHGNEAQVNRDLLSMSIAIYDENPLPYQYCSYAVLETLVPMRKFEYQSPRHNQGVNYGSFRFGWDMHAAWLFYRMSDKPVFDDNIKNVPKFWLYMRAPDGQMLRDGDGFGAPTGDKPYYWGAPQTMFLSYTYAADPILKADFEKQGGLASNPILFLLLNDPGLKPQSSRQSLPLTIDFGPVLGSMVARTGWNIGPESNDVVAEIKGGGYHFGNHQHADAGSIQLFYRGFQLGDIGLYKFYGTPYDLNFNKRSVAHSMMLAVDPKEKFLATESNDGGVRFVQNKPDTPKEAISNPEFNNGRVVSADFGPSKLRPYFSYFAADLLGAYSSKLTSYTRGFCFLNLDRKDIPAAIILTDDMTTANADFDKYWQINTHHAPERTANGFILQNQRDGLVGKTYVEMLIPSAAERKIEILSGTNANSSFKFKYETPPIEQPEAKGHRIMVSLLKATNRDRFLTVLQVADGNSKPLQVSHFSTPESNVVILADRVVSMSNTAGLISKGFSLTIPKGTYQVLLAGMKSGSWNVKSTNGKLNVNAEVAAGKNTIFFVSEGGELVVSPGRSAGAKELKADEDLMPSKK